MGIPIIKKENVSWDGLSIIFYFDEEIDEETNKELKELISSWYIIGINEGFSGKIHNMSEVWYEDKLVGCTVDMGSVDFGALEVLFSSVEGFADIHELVLIKIELA